MSNEYKQCENIIRKLLVREKRLIRDLKEIQKTKMEILLILAGGNNDNN